MIKNVSFVNERDKMRMECDLIAKDDGFNDGDSFNSASGVRAIFPDSLLQHCSVDC